MAYAKRVDANQKKIVDTARKLGYSVAHTHTVACGFPDLVLGKRKINFLAEVKDGSKKKLTEAQIIFHQNWLGTIHIIHSPEELIELDKKLFGHS